MERIVTIAKKSFVPLAVCIWSPILIVKVGLGPYFFREMDKNLTKTTYFCHLILVHKNNTFEYGKDEKETDF